MPITWDAESFSYLIDGEEIDSLVAKGASDAVASEFNAEIRTLSDRLMAGQISLADWYSGMKRATKLLHMAMAALSRGGFEQVRPEDWRRVEQIVEAQWNGVEGEFPGLRAFAEDIARGRYGNDVLSSGVLFRGSQYANAGRATYENERLAGQIERWPMEAMRIRGYTDGCADCVNWAEKGWIDAVEMLTKYHIGASVCGGECGCAIVTRRARRGVAVPVAPLVIAGAVAGAVGIALTTGRTVQRV